MTTKKKIFSKRKQATVSLFLGSVYIDDAKKNSKRNKYPTVQRTGCNENETKITKKKTQNNG